MHFACSGNAVVRLGISSVLVCNVCVCFYLCFFIFLSPFIAFIIITYLLWTFFCLKYNLID